MKKPAACPLPRLLPRVLPRVSSRVLPCLLALSMGLSGMPSLALAQTRLPALGDSASEYLDVGAELRLGEDIMRGIRGDPAYLDDPVLLHYVSGLWRPLVQSGRARARMEIRPTRRRAHPPLTSVSQSTQDRRGLDRKRPRPWTRRPRQPQSFASARPNR